MFSFPRSAWERTSGRSATRPSLRAGYGMRRGASPACVPTRSVGTRVKVKRMFSFPNLVPTLRVGTHVRPLCGPMLSAGWVRDATRSVASLRSHAERGNES